jgi:hypothetical protein
MIGGCGSHFVTVTVVQEKFQLCWTRKKLECACLTKTYPIWGAWRVWGVEVSSTGRSSRKRRGWPCERRAKRITEAKLRKRHMTRRTLVEEPARWSTKRPARVCSERSSIGTVLSQGLHSCETCFMPLRESAHDLTRHW